MKTRWFGFSAAAEFLDRLQVREIIAPETARKYGNSQICLSLSVKKSERRGT
jgi:hypothetical protein